MFQVETIDQITPEYIGTTVHAFITEYAQGYIDNNEYAAGRNPGIINRVLPDDSGPDNRIPVSYAHRIIQLVNGYMYKPGLITYATEGSLPALDEVFAINREPIKTSQMGNQVSTHGVGYEYHYVDAVGIPRFVKLPAAETIPIYNMEIDPTPTAFLRYVIRDETVNIMYVNAANITEYTMPKNGTGVTLTSGPVPHFYKRLPLVLFKNNELLIGDFETVTPLIDAYDVLMSDSMNEFDRFAWAYLLLKGMSLSSENAAKLKRMRAFENLEETTDVAFLTKNIDTAFIQFMSDLIRNEIHRQSGIPNIEDYDGAGASGKTLTKFIYMMELFTDPKEAYFKEGLKDRLDCINRILSIQGKGFDPNSVDIIMGRNRPDNSLEQAQIFQAYAGHVSELTLIENFADFVPDAQEEIERLEEEKKKNVELYGTGLNDAGPDKESNGEGEGDSENPESDGEKA